MFVSLQIRAVGSVILTEQYVRCTQDDMNEWFMSAQGKVRNHISVTTIIAPSVTYNYQFISHCFPSKSDVI